MRECPTAWLKQVSAAEWQNNSIFLQLEEQADTNKGKVILDYEPDICYKQEGADPNDAPDAQEEEEGDNSDAQYEKMEFPHQRIL